MTRRSSPLTRIALVATALATVWSLGCCGFEPLFAQLFASDNGISMACADGTGANTPTGTTSLQAGSTFTAVAASPTVSSPDATCNCDNCLAPSPPLALLSIDRAPAPAVAATEVALTPSVVGAPLVPPPQASTLGA